jgi:hypothetical protein
VIHVLNWEMTPQLKKCQLLIAGGKMRAFEGLSWCSRALASLFQNALVARALESLFQNRVYWRDEHTGTQVVPTRYSPPPTLSSSQRTGDGLSRASLHWEDSQAWGLIFE